ncbi:MAG: hypothetical protein ACOYNL_06795 [Rickettsiales bacterium]
MDEQEPTLALPTAAKIRKHMANARKRSIQGVIVITGEINAASFLTDPSRVRDHTTFIGAGRFLLQQLLGDLPQNQHPILEAELKLPPGSMDEYIRGKPLCMPVKEQVAKKTALLFAQGDENLYNTKATK